MNSSNLFREQVLNPLIANLDRYKTANAFCIHDTFYTYQQLKNTISGICEALNDAELNNKLIGLVVNDDLETYAAILAIWINGLAYVPLHPYQPIDRIKEIIQQTGILSVLDSSENTRLGHYNVIMIRDSSGSRLKERKIRINKASDKDLAYILFTSGSTGKPKGVTLSRENLGAFIESFWETGIQMEENDRCLQAFDLTFDVSVQSFVTPLLKGACVFTIPHYQIKYSYLYYLLTEYQLTFCAVAPSMLRYLNPHIKDIVFPSMHTCILTAEASPVDLVQLWQKSVPNAVLYNFYGPTEATIYCTYYRIDNPDHISSVNGMLSIGKPLKHVITAILDENGNTVEIGKKGELCLSGKQVSPGYWNNPEVNYTAFFNSKEAGNNLRYYHSGDLCSIDEAGNILLYGRSDSQVKIQGYRVELGEIEHHARHFLQGINAVALPLTNPLGIIDIYLIIESKTIPTVDLLAYLKSKMPHYMIPSRILFEPVFPINSNSKVDKLKLKEKASHSS